MRGSASRSAAEDGYTLVEAVSALAIFSILAVSVWTGASLGLRAMFRAADRSGSNAEILLLDARLRRSVGEVVVPFWEAPVAEQEGFLIDAAARISLPYHGGRKESVLSIERTPGGLRLVSEEGEFLVVKRTGSIGFSLRPEGPGAGVEFVLDPAGDQESRTFIHAPFGGIPLVRGGQEGRR